MVWRRELLWCHLYYSLFKVWKYKMIWLDFPCLEIDWKRTPFWETVSTIDTMQNKEWCIALSQTQPVKYPPKKMKERIWVTEVRSMLHGDISTFSKIQKGKYLFCLFYVIVCLAAHKLIIGHLMRKNLIFLWALVIYFPKMNCWYIFLYFFLSNL